MLSELIQAQQRRCRRRKVCLQKLQHHPQQRVDRARLLPPPRPVLLISLPLQSTVLCPFTGTTCLSHCPQLSDVSSRTHSPASFLAQPHPLGADLRRCFSPCGESRPPAPQLWHEHAAYTPLLRVGGSEPGCECKLPANSPCLSFLQQSLLRVMRRQRRSQGRAARQPRGADGLTSPSGTYANGGARAVPAQPPPALPLCSWIC